MCCFVVGRDGVSPVQVLVQLYVLMNFLGGAFGFAFVTRSSDGHVAAAAVVDCGPQDCTTRRLTAFFRGRRTGRVVT